ncbi:hypothetical protein [Actinomadura sp. WMMB 499]|uniref:hypothetical protein n=1 Tax=Actinomadura sp. WMMB 499 TaxID=1219491 RepID=UPI0012456429|nr:hypothetical protein [Actinomadura sp. WMMB 499]QFG25422.1 hypothetical protein F7P10_33960 [Actinomadura sp. WMMB 499]
MALTFTTDLGKRAERGAELLDKARPGWEKEVNLYRLDMMRTDDCVIGQLFGDWGNGLLKLGLNGDGSAEHGFNLGDLAGDYTYTVLTGIWRHLVRSRLN